MEARRTILESSAHGAGLPWPCTGTVWCFQRMMSMFGSDLASLQTERQGVNSR